MQRHGIKFAGGFISIIILSIGGLLTDTAGFVQPEIASVHEKGGCYIVDEV